MDITQIETAERRLKKADPVMAGLIQRYGPLSGADGWRQPPFHAIVRAIVNQQLSAQAGRTIGDRLLALQHAAHHSADAVVVLEEEALRGCGLSGAKVRYIRAISQAVHGGELDFDRLESEDDETVSATLRRYPGLGRWSIEIFLMFALSRPDVLPLGDAALRRSMKKHYRLPEDAGHNAFLAVAEPWRPHRTVASRYLWAASRE